VNELLLIKEWKKEKEGESALAYEKNSKREGRKKRMDERTQQERRDARLTFMNTKKNRYR